MSLLQCKLRVHLDARVESVNMQSTSLPPCRSCESRSYCSACNAVQVGFYGSGITMDKARAAVEGLQEPKRQLEGKGPSDLPFGRDSKRIFESAAEVKLLLL